jgi:trigger factor
MATSADGSFRYRVERIKGSLARIEAEVDAARLRAAADRQFDRHNRQANIPGFRPGKAPRPIYERHFGTQHLWNEGAEDVIEETYREITQREDLDPLDTPQVEIRQLEADKALSYLATVAVRPDVTLGDYAAHGAKVTPTAPTEEDVERVIAGMREHHAELRPVERAAETNDVVTVDIDVDLEGRSLTMARNGHLELGREYAVPGLAQGLMGVTAGEDRTLELTFPEDADEDLRGKTGKFRVRVSAVAEKVLPALDEGFAKTVGVADVAALRKAVRDELAHGAFHEARDSAADAAIKHAIDTSEAEIPEVLLQDELDHMIADLRARATERGLTWERFLLQAKKTEPEIREEWRAAAERRAKSLLVLDAIAKKEGVSVSSTELAQEVALTPLAQQDPKALRDPRVLAAMARSMRNRKVVDKLIGLETPEAERDVLRSLGSDLDPHTEVAEHAAAEGALAAPAGPTAPPAIIVPDRPQGTAEGREAIRKLLETKE